MEVGWRRDGAVEEEYRGCTCAYAELKARVVARNGTSVFLSHCDSDFTILLLRSYVRTCVLPRNVAEYEVGFHLSVSPAKTNTNRIGSSLVAVTQLDGRHAQQQRT